MFELFKYVPSQEAVAQTEIPLSGHKNVFANES